MILPYHFPLHLCLLICAGRAGCDHGNPKREAEEASGGGEPDQGPAGV